jgi:DNA polymerase III epsilon subunit-like protein
MLSLSLQQAKAQLQFNRWNDEEAVILDTETTGIDFAEIVEISVIDMKGNVLYESFVKPKGDIPSEARDIHGITEKMVKDAPTWMEVWPEVYPILKDRIVLMYNADFHIRAMKTSFLVYETMDEAFEEEFRQIDGLQSECVMIAYAQYKGDERWRKLSEACGYNIRHRALDDCRAILEVIRKCYKSDFTNDDYRKIKIKEEINELTKKSRYLSYRIHELSEEQVDLQKRLKELLQEYFADLTIDLDDPVDITDDDLPF